MHGAIVLANYIYSLSSTSTADEIQGAFEAYKAERIDWVEKAFETSRIFKKMVDTVRKTFSLSLSVQHCYGRSAGEKDLTPFPSQYTFCIFLLDGIR